MFRPALRPWSDVAAELIAVAARRAPADLVIRNCTWVNVHSREALPGLPAAANGWTQDGALSFSSLFSSIGWMEVRLINPDGVSAIVGVDNVRLVPAPGAAAPALLVLIALRRRRR